MVKLSDAATPSLLFTEGTEPSAPAAGHQRLYFDSTTHKLMATNSSGAERSIESSGSGSLVWLQRQTASASATLDFTSFISSTYDVYRFDFVNLFPATDNVSLSMRMGTGGGPTYETGSNYHWATMGSSSSGAGAGPATSITLTPAVDTGAGSAWTITGSILLFNPMSTTVNKFVSGQFVELFNTGPAFVHNTVGASYSLTTAVTAVRFFMSSGNITSGSIDCYGLTHA